MNRKWDNGFFSAATGVSLIFSVFALITGLFASEILLRQAYSVNLRQILPAYAVISFLCLRFTNAYRVGRRRLYETCYAVFVSVVIINAGMLILPFFDIEYGVSVATVALTTLTQLVLLLVWALLFHRLHFAVKGRRTAVIVADTQDNALYCAEKVKSYSMEFEVAGALSLDDALELPACDTVIAYGLDAAAQEALYWRCADVNKDLCVAPRVFQLSVHGGVDAQFGDLMALRLRVPGLTPEQAAVKRAFDICLSLAAIIIAALPVAALSLAIYAYDRHSPFYVQRRLTRGGRTFDCIKLRTMVEDAESETGPVLAIDNDPRVTPLGAFLRRTRLDELPQFINVMMGDMSVVGPRPEREHFAQAYMKDVPDFKRRLAVKAGITGFAHVYGRYDTPPVERINLDMYYIFNYSMRLDIKILIETARIMCSRSYAQGVKGRRPQ